MTKKLRGRTIVLAIVLLCVVIASVLVFLQMQYKNTSTTPAEQSTQPTNFSTNSPEGVTQAYYNWYALCLKQHTQDLQNADKLKNDCPLHGNTGLSNGFVQKNVLTYTDQVFCDEGIPMKINIEKAYIEKDQTASVNVITIFQDHHFVIPIRLRKENGSWKIFRIDCDLDGHLD